VSATRGSEQKGGRVDGDHLKNGDAVAGLFMKSTTDTWPRIILQCSVGEVQYSVRQGPGVE